MQKIKKMISGAGKGGETEQEARTRIITSIIRMSQKALMYVLAMIGIGYIGGLIAILFKPELSQAMTEYANIFIPVFQLEIGVYGLGSTLENVQKIKAQVDGITKKTDLGDPDTEENEDGEEISTQNG